MRRFQCVFYLKGRKKWGHGVGWGCWKSFGKGRRDCPWATMSKQLNKWVPGEPRVVNFPPDRGGTGGGRTWSLKRSLFQKKVGTIEYQLQHLRQRKTGLNVRVGRKKRRPAVGLTKSKANEKVFLEVLRPAGGTRERNLLSGGGEECQGECRLFAGF